MSQEGKSATTQMWDVWWWNVLSCCCMSGYISWSCPTSCCRRMNIGAPPTGDQRNCSVGERRWNPPWGSGFCTWGDGGAGVCKSAFWFGPRVASSRMATEQGTFVWKENPIFAVTADEKHLQSAFRIHLLVLQIPWQRTMTAELGGSFLNSTNQRESHSVSESCEWCSLGAVNVVKRCQMQPWLMLWSQTKTTNEETDMTAIKTDKNNLIVWFQWKENPGETAKGPANLLYLLFSYSPNVVMSAER